jgi:cyclopropane-fatty-acyl-phospholipid synthase
MTTAARDWLSWAGAGHRLSIVGRSARELVEDALARAGVLIGGDRPWDIRVHDDRLFDRAVRDGALGVGEGYMDGWWDSAALDETLHRFLRANLDGGLDNPAHMALAKVRARVFNLQSRARSRHVADAHYDLGNDLFEHMLGPTMVYSCAYWRRAADLDAAQEAKLALVCDKLGIGAGDTLLDIGCGWGSLARYAAARRGARVVGVTISEPQAAYAREACRGLPVDIRVLDYRHPSIATLGPFTKIASLGMFEHVGRKNYAEFFRIARGLLPENGLMLLQTIGVPRTAQDVDPWTDRYIFPNGILPAPASIASALEGRFVIEDWHAFGADYDRTLMAWAGNFERYAAGPGRGRGARFHRMWRYYLHSFAAGFRAGDRLLLWQIVMSPRGVPGGYASVR